MSDNFPKFASAVDARFDELSKHELYTVDVERDELFDLYLASFPEGTNPIFRVRTQHDGSYDRAFVRNVGHVVAIVNGKIETVWNDLQDLPAPYDIVAAVLAERVRSKAITGVFRTRERYFGHEDNFEVIDGKTYRFTHFAVDVAARHKNGSPAEARGSINTNFGVFKRGVTELTIDALNTVLDLINAKNLYRGQEHAAAVTGFYKLKTDYDAAPNKEVFLWSNVNDRFALFRNTVIGTLVTDLSAGEDLEKAVRLFESKVAPQNYKRPTALITPKMAEQAVDKLKELGLEGAVERRFAKLSDVSVNNVLFVNNDVRGQMKDGLVGLLMEEVKPKPVDIKNAEDISIEDFFKHKLPLASSIDLLVENRHMGNFMSLTAPVHENTGRLFKWNNDFAWSYDGDVTDSIKQRVKTAGGNVDAPLRVSLGWHNGDDLDLHAHCPNGHVYFRSKMGILDVDMNGLDKHDDENPVENLSWANYRDGRYQITVNSYSRTSKRKTEGFEVEFFFNGESKIYAYPNSVSHGQTIILFDFTIRDGKVIDFKPDSRLSVSSISKEKWGVKTETLVPVNTLLVSPNHWDDQAIGNKHWFFILKDCVNPDQARGIYNEFLRGELEPHRKVFEILGAKTKTQPSTEQLSGLGFSSTRQDSAIVVVKGATINKAFRINF